MPKGLVIKSTGSWYSVRADDGSILNCRIRGKFRTSGLRTTNPVAVGDNVEFEMVEADGTGVITSILERRNYIIRKSSNLSHEAHILAANLDLALMVVCLKNPETPLEFIDRFLATAQAYSIPSKIVVNKTDLLEKDGDKLMEFRRIYDLAGYETILTSTVTGEGMDRLRELTEGRISFLSGNSGVGKSSLINCLIPKANLKTGNISDFHHTGKHTTTFAEMIPLDNSGYIIDSPGIKGFGMVRMEKEEISHYFPEIFAHSADCQYHNCHHTSEPGCAVRQAVIEGKIHSSRYNSYLDLFTGEDSKYRPAF